MAMHNLEGKAFFNAISKSEKAMHYQRIIKRLLSDAREYRENLESYRMGLESDKARLRRCLNVVYRLQAKQDDILDAMLGK